MDRMSTPTSLHIDRNIACPMRDGTVLRCDIYRPALGGRFPVLLNRTPYGKTHPKYVTSLILHPFDAITRGYVVVVQDTRGRYESDGEWTPLHGEAEDGYDTVEWAARQPWSNGDVAIFGSSYMGVTALQAAAAHPPHLHAVVAYLTGANYHDGWVYSGGAFELLFNLRWCAKQALETLNRSALEGKARERALERLLWINDNPEEAVNFTPVEEVFGQAEIVVPYWRQWLRHSSYDDYWRAVDATDAVAAANIPVLNIAGWYDGLLKGQMDLHRAITRRRERYRNSAREELMIGPWDHETYHSVRPTFAGEASFGSHSIGGTPGLGRKVLDWLDGYLRSPQPCDEGRDPVTYFMMGPNEWRTSRTWPPSSREKSMYLSGGNANSSNGDGKLTDEAPPDQSVNKYVHDPRHPVPTIGGRHLGYWYRPSGVVDQAQVEMRPDILVFTSDPFPRDVQLAGQIRVELYVRSSAKSSDFTAKLVDVRVDGYCANIAEGIQRVTLNDETDPQLVKINLWDSAYVFPTGSKVRLEIASSNFPRFDVNGGLSETPAATHRSDWRSSMQEVFSGAAFPSRVILQLV